MIDGLKPYPEMKDSGVPCLGEVPAHWDVEALGRSIRVKSGDMISAEDERESGVPIYGGNGVRGYTFRPNSHGPTIVLGRVGAKCGCVHLVHGPFWASEHALRVTLVTEVNLRFLALVLEHADLNRLAIRTAQPLINSTIVRTHRVVLPPLPEQAAIVRFLDHADRRIRRYTRAKQKLIKLLEEQKQAIIDRAVTRGIDPNVGLKASGVEWMGDVPEHWDVRPLKHCIRRGTSISYGIVQPGEHTPGGVPFVQTGNLTKQDFEPETLQRTTPEIAAKYPRSVLAEGDVLLGIRASVGMAAVAPPSLEGANLSRGIARMVTGASLKAEFAVLCLRSRTTQLFWATFQQGTTFNEIPIGLVRTLPLVVPPVEEQQRIVAAVLEQCRIPDGAIKSVRQELALLREFRTRLIADVVTGKLDVREAGARLREEAEEPEALDETAESADLDADANAYDGGLESEELEA